MMAAPLASTAWNLAAPQPGYRAPLACGLALAVACVLAVGAFTQFPALQFTLSSGAGLAVHTLLELVSVVACLMVFSVGWATYSRHRDDTVAAVSSAFLAAAVLDFVHLLLVDGMPASAYAATGATDALGHAVRPVPSFLAARLVVALVLLATALAPRHQGGISRHGQLTLFAGSLAFAGCVAAWSMADERLAALFFDEQGQVSGFKAGVEHLLAALYLTAALAFAARMRAAAPGREPQAEGLASLFTACCVLAVSQWCFTLYTSTADQYIILGHVFKALAHVLVCHAIFGEAVRRPYRDLKRLQADLRQSEERYRQLFEHGIDAVVVVEPGGRVLDANPAATTLLGLPLERLRQCTGTSFLDMDDPRRTAIRDARLRCGAGRGEVRLRRADGSTFDAEVSSVGYRDSTGRLLVSVCVRDISERARAREQIMQLNASLEGRVRERTAQLEAVNRELEAFSHTVAHDLRQPLGAINGFSGAMAAHLNEQLGEQGRRYLDRIRAATRCMEEMIGGLLELARLSRSELQCEATDLAPMAEAIMENCRIAAPGRHVQAQVHGPLPVRGDRRLLRLALDNLLGNAWKFTGKRERAAIDVGCETDARGRQVYYVRDNGAGFDMSMAGRLFTPFQRLHSQADFNGHGIGLANVRRIITLHGGDIWAEARPGEGACFFFTLAP